jgi:aminoglycoside phosphotransferase (APT) family kinase protein
VSVDVAKQDVGDLEKIRVGIEAWLRVVFEDRPGLEIGDLNFPETSGESSVTLLLDGRWPDGGSDRFVLRMAPPTSQVFESHDLLMQYQMMSLMHEEGIPAPPLVGYEADETALGGAFYVMGFTEGQIPPDNPPFAMAGWVKEALNDLDRERMWRAGLETLAAIHRINIEKHDLSRLPRAGAGESILSQEIRTFDSMFKPELRAAADPRILEGWEALVTSVPTEGEIGLCWGDARVGNVIFRDLAPVAILDWEMANISDPLTDLAWWVWIDRCNSEGLGVPRLGGLPSPRDIYAQWHQLTGRSIDQIAWFELFAVVRYAIILERKFTAMREMNPEVGIPSNFPAEFIPDLLKAARKLV